MALSFGVTVLPDPPYQRLIELLQLAEGQGFEYGWTYDSHVLWQESTPTLALAAAATERIKLGHMVTNPGTREPTVVASSYATLQDISDGRMVMGIGRGDSARRYINQKPVPVAKFEEAIRMIKPFMNGESVHWNDTDLQLSWVRPELPPIEMHVAGYGPRVLGLAGRYGDGVIIQLADPDIIQWTMGTARAAAEEAGRDPAQLKCIVCAPSHISDDIEAAREQVRWFPAMVSNHVRDLIKRYGSDGSVVPTALTDYVPEQHGLRLRRALARRRQARRVRERRDLRPLLRDRDRRAGRGEAGAARVDRRRPVQHLPDDRGPGADARDLRPRDHPALRRRDWRCSMRKLVQGGTVVTATNSSVADVLIDGEEIVAVGALGDVDAELIDASGCYVLPGLIDNHTHMAMPFGGTNSIDDYDTGTRAAAAGGTTCIVDFVIQQHPDGLRSSLDEWRGRADGAAHVDYGFHMAITQADDGTFADMEPMVEEGICTFKVFLAYKGVLMVTDDLFFRVLETTRDLGALTMVHCENGWVIDVLVERALAAGQTDPIYHALTRPESVEAEATSRSVRLAEQAGAGVYIVHVTCGLAADEIAAGQARGVKVYGETCLQYLTNTVHDLERPDFEGGRYVCSPPLREAHNQELLWSALDRGVLESVSTDHCPFNSEQKALGRDDFSKIPNGLAMIQHRLVKLWDLGVETGRITPNELVDMTSTAIAHRFGLARKGSIAPGMDADLVVFDPSTPFEFSTRTSHMNVDYDLFEGESSTGSVRHTLCRGTMVYDRGEILTEPGHGRFVPRSLGAHAAVAS